MLLPSEPACWPLSLSPLPLGLPPLLLICWLHCTFPLGASGYVRNPSSYLTYFVNSCLGPRQPLCFLRLFLWLSDLWFLLLSISFLGSQPFFLIRPFLLHALRTPSLSSVSSVKKSSMSPGDILSSLKADSKNLFYPNNMCICAYMQVVCVHTCRLYVYTQPWL